MTDQFHGQMLRAEQPRRRRRLSDKIMIAFHSACDQGDIEGAYRLIAIVELARLDQRTKAN